MLPMPELKMPQPLSVAPIPFVYVAEPVAWEYLQVADEHPPDEAKLNALGREGWELAGILDRDSQVLFFFKRQTRA